jgi:predicted transporter
MSRTEMTTRTTVQKAALAVAAVFALVGVAGFIPGITTNYDTMSFAGHESQAMLLGGGAVYLLLWLYGLMIDHDSSANFVPVNNADNWLHLLLGVGMIGLGLALRRSHRRH